MYNCDIVNKKCLLPPVVVLLLLLLFIAPVFGKGTKANSARVYGKVVDFKSKKPVEYASVVLMLLGKDSLLTGALTENKGDFSLDNLPFGTYRLRISYTGYLTFEQKIIISSDNPEKDLGNLVLKEDEKTLAEVNVSADKQNLKLAVDKKVFNVDKDISSRGGNGMDVMKNIPGVAVDADGNITLRNNTPQIYVDGKPTTLTLDQIPSDQIDRVEVITNPSAKFEAESSGGILNVVLKHSALPGYNVLASALIGTNAQYNATAQFNAHVNKFGFMGSFNANGVTNNTIFFDNRTNLDPATGLPVDYFNQNLSRVNKRDFQFVRAGLDYYLSNRNTLSLSQSMVFGKFYNDINADINSLDANGSQVSYGKNYNYEGVTRNNFTTTLDFKHTYPVVGKEYSITISYNHAKEASTFLDTTNTFSPAGMLLDTSAGTWKQGIKSGQSSDMITAQWDFSHPVKHNVKLEYGLRSYYKRTTTFANVSSFVYNLGDYQPDAGLSNNYVINELVNGAYVTMSQQVRKFSYQLGVRYEASYFSGALPDKNVSFSYQYPLSAARFYQPFFPSLYLSQKFGDKHELQLNVTRKISRPGFGQLNPNVEVIDKSDYEQGNPHLQPEFGNQAELNYNLSIPKLNWLSSVYGRYTEQPITSYSSDSASILFITFINGKGRFTYGWENTMKISPVKNLDFTLDGNVFYTSIQANPAPGVLLNNAGISWFAKAIVTYKFPLGFSAQVNGSYEAPKIVPQGKTVPVYFFDLSASKDLGIATVNFTLSDVLDSKRNGYDYATPDFVQSLTKRRETRYAKLSVVFKFGKEDPLMLKQKKQKKEKEEDTGD